MITHEELYNQAMYCVDTILMDTSISHPLEPIYEYLKYGKKLETRLEKVIKLLGLIMYYMDYNLFPSEVVDKIKELERELNEQ